MDTFLKAQSSQIIVDMIEDYVIDILNDNACYDKLNEMGGRLTNTMIESIQAILCVGGYDGELSRGDIKGRYLYLYPKHGSAVILLIWG